MTSNSGWNYAVNVNLPFGLGGVSGGFSGSMSWTSMDTTTTSEQQMVSSGNTETVTVGGNQCVYVVSEVSCSTGQSFSRCTSALGSAQAEPCWRAIAASVSPLNNQGMP